MSLGQIAGFRMAVDGVGLVMLISAACHRKGRNLMTTADAAGGPAQDPLEASLSVLSRPACTIAMLAGALDIATIPALRERLLNVLGSVARLLIIDLSGVSFCDVAGLAMLIDTQRHVCGRDITVRLAAPRPQLAKLLRTTGMDRSFTICATVDDALPGQQDRAHPVTQPPSPGDQGH
jgi:anti-sigma B factor antagonist